ncbi:MAG: helix-turn-helix domain-containing protein [Candidatus Delongbacteria bacterium]
MNMQKIGEFIRKMRTERNVTQKQIGERLNISYQAVSKWERGETLPDTMLLIDLASVLETSVDTLLRGGETVVNFKKNISVKAIKKGIENLSTLGDLIGTDNTLYKCIVEGINKGMVLDVEECFDDPFKKEALIVEIIVQNIVNGAYVDISDAHKHLKFDHWRNIVSKYANRHGIK